MTLLMPISRVGDAEKLIARFSGLTVVIDQMADCPVDRPEQLEALLALARYPKVFVKISHTWSLSREGYSWVDAQQMVKRLYERFGPQRLTAFRNVISSRTTVDLWAYVARSLAICSARPWSGFGRLLRPLPLPSNVGSFYRAGAGPGTAGCL